MGCIMSKDYMNNLDFANNIANRIHFPHEVLSESIKSFMDSYKAAINSISYQDVIPNSLKAVADSFRDISKAIDLESISALTNMQALAKSVSDTASTLQSVHLQNSLDVLKGIAFRGLSSMGDMSQLFGSIPDDITVDTVSELIKNGEITDEDFQAELKSTITGTENEAVKGKSSIIQKALKFVAVQIILFLLATVFSPVTDKVKEEIIETLRVNEFWQSTGIIDWIDSWSNDNHTATEDEAKATVDESKTGNISKQKREDLLSKVKKIRNFISNAPQDENTGNLLSYLSEIEKDINGKKYGLVFEEHREDIDEVLETHTPVLTEETDLFIDNGGQMNFLIEGDNLASLKLLEKTHKGQIDLIYIDPPYNTGSKDFVYDDTYVDKTDLFSHSKWLSFMKPRLEIMRNLLNELHGVIFISIDDNEQAALKLLCDEIFSDSCFVTDAVWRSSDNSNNNSLKFSEDYNHTLIYSKTPLWKPNFINDPNKRKHFKNPDNDPRGPWFDGNPVNNPGWRPNLQFDITAPNGNIIKHPKNGWRWSRETIEEKLKTGELRFSEDGTRLIRRTYLYEMGGLTPSNLWIDLETTSHTRRAKYDLKKIFPEIKVTDLFSTPKPTALVEYILDLSTKKDSIILDCFAGSGTTGHAVLKYNSEHENSKRSFIMCTNNENGICRDVTYERIRRVIDNEKYAASLKYYKVDYLPISERMYYEYADELLRHIRELVELENGINFIDNAGIAIVLTDDELDNFTQNIEQYSACRKLYMGHDLLPDEDQERIIEENNIEINIIPDYYYRDLQEA